jgi:cell division protein FtsN
VGGSVLYPVTPAAQTPPAAAKAPTIDSILAENAQTPAKPLIKAKPAPAAPPPAAKPVAKEEATPVAKSGAFVVQIGAFSSQALADRSWDQAAGLAPGQMAGKGKRVAPLAKNGATLYRTSITGFSTRAEAEGLCAKLTAAGRTCFVR